MSFVKFLIVALLVSPMLQAQSYYPYSDGKKWGFVCNQKVAIAAAFDSVLFPHNRNHHLVMINGNKQALYDRSGKQLTPFDYDHIEYNLSSNTDFFYVKVGEKYGFIDSLGNLICKPKYDQVYSFDEKNGLCRVMVNKRWGLINRSGKEVLKPTYDAIHFFSEDGSNTFVTQNGKVAHISNTGKLMYAPAYEDVWMMEGKTQKFAVARLNGKWGLIDSKGKAVYPFELDHLQFEELASDGLPVFSGSGNGKRIYLKGTEVLDHYTMTSTNNQVYTVMEEKLEANTVFGISKLVIKKNDNGFEVTDKAAALNLQVTGAYDSVTVVSNRYYYTKGNLVLKVWKDRKVGLIDQAGKIIIPVEQDAIEQLWMYSHLLVSTRNEKKSITSVGYATYQTPYDYVHFTCCSGGDSYSAQYIFTVRADGYKGYLNTDGENYFPQ